MRKARGSKQRKPDNAAAAQDFVDRMLAEIHAEYPDRDSRAMAAVSRIQRAAFFFEAGLARVAAKAGLNVRELLAIAALRRAGPDFCLNPTQLLKECFAPSATMTRQVDHLESLGLVERNPDPGDRRGILVRLTRRGHSLIDSTVMLGMLADEPEMHTANTLTSGEIDALNRILRKLLVRLEGENSNPASKPAAASKRRARGKKTYSAEGG
ncbi:MAG TPA: MarR family transcriptional regulator [Candidatus Binataceae bacterium]|nr:MarR family transcriptional regulator [Candidatus Binataceae bacterium]